MRVYLEVVLCLAVIGSFLPSGTAEKKVMPWMCLQRCGGNATTIAANLQQIADHNGVLTAVAYEDFNLGPNSTLVLNALANVTPKLAGDKVALYPMVSSYPYPPQFLSWMRQVWTNPQPFIDACLKQAAMNGFSGYNIDWEPAHGTILPSDPFDYANFLGKLADALHEHGMTLTVDVASWSPIWNYTAIAESSVDAIMIMSTYTDDYDSFVQQLELAVAEIPLSKLSIGLMTTKASNGQPYTAAELMPRFHMLSVHDIQSISIWKSPIPENWWPFVDAFSGGL